MANKKPNYLKTAIRLLFTFALSLCIVLAGLLFTWKYWMYSGDAPDRFFVEEDYESMLDDIMYSAENKTIPTGLDSSVLDGIFTLESVKKDASGNYSAAFGGPAYTADTSAMEQKLAEQVHAYIDSLMVEQTKTSEKALDAYLEEIAQLYVNQLNIAPIRIAASYGHTVQKLIRYGLMGLGVMSLVMMLLIALLRDKFFASLSYAFGGAGLMLGVAPTVLLVSKLYEKVQISPLYLKSFLLQFLSEFLQRCVQMAGICFAIMLVFILLSELFGRRKAIK